LAGGHFPEGNQAEFDHDAVDRPQIIGGKGILRQKSTGRESAVPTGERKRTRDVQVGKLTLD
jgi:hypothetical protein